jgi:two-component system KDP operon response regulator KdpE
MLPDRSGLELCADLRARTDAPIVVCSATRRHDDRELAFQLGAVDFVAKPFHLPDLEARIEAVRRRSSGPAGPTPPSRQRIGQLVVDRAARRVRLAGRPVHLTPTELAEAAEGPVGAEEARAAGLALLPEYRRRRHLTG